MVVEAREVIVAIPPVLAAQIHFAPKLPQAHRKLLSGIHAGSPDQVGGDLRAALLA